ALVSHAGHDRRKRGQLLINLRRMAVIPVSTQPVGNVLNNLPVGSAFAERLKCSVEPLDASLGTGKGSFLLKAWRGREDNIGKAASLGEEYLLHNKEIELGQCRRHIVSVGIDQAHLLAED